MADRRIDLVATGSYDTDDPQKHALDIAALSDGRCENLVVELSHEAISNGLTDNDRPGIGRLQIAAATHVARETVRARLSPRIDTDDLDGDNVRSHGDQRLCPCSNGDRRHSRELPNGLNISLQIGEPQPRVTALTPSVRYDADVPGAAVRAHTCE